MYSEIYTCDICNNNQKIIICNKNCGSFKCLLCDKDKYYSIEGELVDGHDPSCSVELDLDLDTDEEYD